jgi:hypothetical protein
MLAQSMILEKKEKEKPLKQCQFWHKKEDYFKIKLGSGQVLSR